jgi:hypothetical protein
MSISSALLAKKKPSKVMLTEEFAAIVNEAVGKYLSDRIVIKDLWRHKKWAEFLDSRTSVEKSVLNRALGQIWGYGTLRYFRKHSEDHFPHTSTIIIPGEPSIAFFTIAFKKRGEEK